MTHGYHGRYLDIDLTNARSTSPTIPNASAATVLGRQRTWRPSAGIIHRSLLFAFRSRGTARVCFQSVVGTPLTTSAKFAVVSKSPLTDRLNDSLASSRFALAGKRSGHDAIVLRGSARTPQILVIDEHQVRFEPADDLWGLEISACEAQLRERFPQHASAVIGPAGERLVRFAPSLTMAVMPDAVAAVR